MFVKTSKKTISSFVSIEKLRSRLAKEHEFLRLKETYSTVYPQISNSNTGSKWDVMNEIDNMSNSNPMAIDRSKIIASLIKGRRLKILDVGFGPGRVEGNLYGRSSSISLLGVDISANSVKLAKKRYPNWLFVNADVLSLKLKHNLYDYIISSEVLEHIDPHETFEVLGKFYSSLKNGGKLIISVPVNEGLEQMLSKGENPNSHVRIYSGELLEAELLIAGFEVIKKIELYAFNKMYKVKSIIARCFRQHFEVNNLIYLAKKP